MPEKPVHTWSLADLFTAIADAGAEVFTAIVDAPYLGGGLLILVAIILAIVILGTWISTRNL